MRAVARRSVVALKNINTGELFDNSNIGLRRPGDGLPPVMIDKLYGLTATHEILRGERIALKDICL